VFWSADALAIDGSWLAIREGGELAMTCPYLTQVTMVFCQASPVKKLIPTDRVSTASSCEAGYQGCPLYREALVRLHRTVEEVEAEEKAFEIAEEKGAQP
jgi:hypothetical protein